MSSKVAVGFERSEEGVGTEVSANVFQGGGSSVEEGWEHVLFCTLTLPFSSFEKESNGHLGWEADQRRGAHR